VSKRSQQLVQYLVDISTNLQEAANLFGKGLRDLSHPEFLAANIKRLEEKGDELTSELLSLINATYITPLDREDYLELALRMDDIVDGLEACTVRFDLYQITEATTVMFEFAQNIADSVDEIAGAMSKLQARKLLELREHTQRLNQLEKTGDALLRSSLRSLFSEATDAVQLIKLKEIYEILEGITDKCEDVGDVLDSVIVKNA
jgi:predicted phosphate transport protein (TIGR00153 family)